MNQLMKLKESLQEQYGINVDNFLELYTAGVTRDEMIQHFRCTSFKLRMIGSTLNLRWATKHRANDLALLKTREDGFAATYAEEMASLMESVQEYEKEITTREKSLVRVRRETTRLRKSLREESLDDVLLAIIEDLQYTIEPIQAPLCNKPIASEAIDFVLLSDIHAGAKVSSKDVPDNEYSWEILQSRLEQVFTEALKAQTGNTLHLYLLGDMLDGLIHDSLESADMNPAEAARELALLLTSFIEACRSHYQHIQVFCLNGNHSRLTDRIKSNAKGFDFEYLMYSILEAHVQKLVEHFEISTVGMIIAETTPGVFIGLHHGDNFRGSSNTPSRDLQILERFRQIGTDVVHILQGHTHIYESHVLPTGGYAVCNGSLIGTNAYVHTNGFLPVSSVQVIGSWAEDGQLKTIRPVSV